MCGLTGCASVTPQVGREWLVLARDTLEHRGPDDAGEWWSADGRVGLAHRRLSILDLTPLGHQPMHLPGKDLSIVFNGEIYNFAELREQLLQLGHRFRSHCDTEVILAAYAEWGFKCLQKLSGMFAFALYDGKAQRLLLARDRAGEKPLFYRVDGRELFFASELKALLSKRGMPRRVDLAALDCYLMMGYVPGDRCILDGYRKLPPAHALSFDLHTGAVRVWRYWDLPDYEPDSSDEGSLLEELETLMEMAVKRQLRADVPVGVLLSGGIDSSLVTAMAVRSSSNIRTFSIGFPGHGDADETFHARQVAKHFGTKHTVLMAEPASAELLPLLARQFDEPVADSSMVPTFMVSRLVREQCTVALGGDGGDELFAGYQRYSQLLRIQDRFGTAPHSARAVIAWSARLLPTGAKGRNFLRAVNTDFTSDLPFVFVFFDAASRRRLMQSHSPWSTPADDVVVGFTAPGTDLIQRATRTDFGTYLPEDILVKVDRASMLNSLEVRSPLLDQALVEFAFRSVPTQFKATESRKKILPKLLTERLLPAEFDRQRKQGFSIPIADWLKHGPFRDLFFDVLTRSDCTFNRRAVQNLFVGQKVGLNNGDRLFALLNFELWRMAYGTHI